MRFFIIIAVFLGACSQNLLSLAKVNGDAISVGDFKLRLREIEFDPKLVASDELLNLKKNILNEMIEEKILQQEAEKLNIQVEPGELQAMHVENLDRILDERKMTKEYWLDRTRHKIMAEKLFGTVTGNVPTPGENEIEAFYSDNLEAFHQKEEVHIQQIVAKDEVRAEEIQKALSEGESFSSIVQRYSTLIEGAVGGDLGSISKDDLPEELGKKVFSMKVGTTSPVIELDRQFHIVKLIDKKPEKQLSLEESRQRIQTMLWQKAKEHAYSQWLQDKMLKARIKRNHELLQDNIHP